MQLWRAPLVVLLLVLGLAACGGGDDLGSDTGSAAGDAAASVSFEDIEDGATVESPVHLEFEAENLEIEEAGAVTEGAGHFHLMVDTPCVAAGEPIPDDESHRHFGDASEETELELEPGEHTLCLQLGDGAHTAVDVTEEITVTVE